MGFCAKRLVQLGYLQPNAVKYPRAGCYTARLYKTAYVQIIHPLTSIEQAMHMLTVYCPKSFETVDSVGLQQTENYSSF